MTQLTQSAEGAVGAFSIDSAVLVELLREGMVMIRQAHHEKKFKVKKKKHAHRPDVTTDADFEVQEHYFNMLRRLFPKATILCEEVGKKAKGRLGRHEFVGPYGMDLRITVDPIDGTEAFSEGRLHQVTTMISFVEYGRVVAVFIGLLRIPVTVGGPFKEDVVLAYAPDIDGIQLIDREGYETPVETAFTGDFTTGPMLLRRPVEGPSYSARAKALIDRFERVHDSRGSLGLWIFNFLAGHARVGALSTDSKATPWDSSPVFGLLMKAGFSFYRLRYKALVPCDPELPVTSYKRKYEIFALHETDLSKVEELTA